MSNILLKVQQYLDNVSKNPVKLDKQLVQEFGEACKNALLNSLKKLEEISLKLECLILVDHCVNYRWRLKVLKVKDNLTM